MKRFFALLSILMISAVAFAQDMKDGLRLIDVEKYNEATTWFQSKIDAQPTVTLYLYLAGEAQLLSGNIEKANAYFAKGMNADAASPLFVAASGAVLAEQGKTEEAKVVYDKAFAMCAAVNDPVVLMYTARAMMIAEVKSATYALQLINRVISLDKKGNMADADFLLGVIHLELGNGGEAVRAFEHSSDKDKTSAKPFWKLGYLYTRSRAASVAQPFYEKALQMDPALAPIYRDMGDFYFLSNQTQKAIESYQKYLSLIENNNDARLKYASFLLINKQYGPAYLEAKKLQEQNYKNVYLNRILGHSAAEVDSVNEGLKAMIEFMAKAPEKKINARDFQYYGRLLMKSGNDSSAQIQFDKAIGMDADLAIETYTIMADYYFKVKKYQLCVNASEKLLAVKTSNNAVDYFLMGRAYYNMKEYVKADSAFSKLLELSPTYVPGHVYKARSVQGQEKKQGEGLAKPYFEKVIELATDAVKYKKELIEANRYLGLYYYTNNDKANAKIHLGKVLELDPQNKDAKVAMANLK